MAEQVNVVQSLFGLTPTNVQRQLDAEAERRAMELASLSRSPVAASEYYGLRSAERFRNAPLFGQNPRVAQAEQVQGVVQSLQQQGVDMATPEGLTQLAGELNKNPEFAGMALALRQEAAKKQAEARKRVLEEGKLISETQKNIAQAEKEGRETGPFGKINPADFTPESVRKFEQSNKYSDLVPLPGKGGTGSEFERLIAELPAAEQAAAKKQRLTNLLSGGGLGPAETQLALKEADAISGIAFGAQEVKTVLDDLKSGKLKLGLAENFANSFKTAAGRSDEASRSYSRFQTSLETLRNARLNLNVGVQTEGDAVRAANEFLANYDRYDTKTAQQQLERVFDKLSAAYKSKENRLRSLYGQRGINIPTNFFTSFEPASTPAVNITDDVIRAEFNSPKNASWQRLGYEKFKEAFLKQNSGK